MHLKMNISGTRKTTTSDERRGSWRCASKTGSPTEVPQTISIGEKPEYREPNCADTTQGRLASKTLNDKRTAGLVALRRRDRHADQVRLWAVSVDLHQGWIVLKNFHTARWGQIWENKIPNYSNFDGVTRRNQPAGERCPTFQKFAVAAKSFSAESVDTGHSLPKRNRYLCVLIEGTPVGGLYRSQMEPRHLNIDTFK